MFDQALDMSVCMPITLIIMTITDFYEEETGV